jgi:hypothetical protein
MMKYTSNFLFIQWKKQERIFINGDGGQNLIGPQLRIIRSD